MVVTSSDLSPSKLPSAQESEPTTEEQDQRPSRTRVRILLYIVNAIRNIGKTLNPTVNFRKRNLSELEFSTDTALEAKKMIRQKPELLKRAYTHTASGRLVWRTTRTTSGNKTYYLFRARFPVQP